VRGRIFLSGVFCAGLLCACASTVTIPPDVRPNIAQPLQQAQILYRGGFSVSAMSRIKDAEAVPNQSDAEKEVVAEVKTRITGGQRSGSAGFARFSDTYEDGARRETLPQSYLPRGDVGPNNPD
jgi:hypothetical protein